VETIVAIGILAMSLTAAITLVQRGLRTTFNSRDQIAAFYLAQESLEQIKALRDSNKLAGRINNVYQSVDYWLSGLDDTVNGCISNDGTKHCKMNVFNTTAQYGSSAFIPWSSRVQACIQASCAEPLQYIPESGYGLYGYFSSSPAGTTIRNTNFSRDIVITTPLGGDADEAKVQISVTWRSGTGVRTVTLTEYLKNF